MSDEPDDPAETRVVMSKRTARALRACGGNLYVWADANRMPRAQTTPPAAVMEFDVISHDGWSVHIDSGIEPPSVWLIQWKPLPRPRFVALYDPPDYSSSVLDAVPDAVVLGLFDWL